MGAWEQGCWSLPRTKHGANRLAEYSGTRNGLPAAAIHGNKKPEAHAQKALADSRPQAAHFWSQRFAARGLDIRSTNLT